MSQYVVIGDGRLLHVVEHVNVNLLYDHLITFMFIIFVITEHRVHIYDSNFFKSLYHCEGERRAEASNNEPNAVVDASFQRGGGLWSGSCGTANEMDSSFTINNIAPSNRIVGGMETARHQYPWMVIYKISCQLQ